MIPIPPKDEQAIASISALLDDAQASYDLVKYKRQEEFKPEKERLKVIRDNLKDQLRKLEDTWLPIHTELDDIQQAILSYDAYEKQAEHGVTSISIPRYKKWVENTFDVPKRDDDTTLRGRLDSILGTAFHNYAEEIIGKLLPDVSLEESIVATVDGYEVGGTADIVDRRSGKAHIGDHKTTKVFSSGKALRGEVDKWVYQLSIYRYLLHLNGEDTDDTGTIYVWVTGWTGKDKDTTPKLYRMDIPLMPIKQTKNYIVRQIEAVQEKPELDCAMWLCTYCEASSVCPSAGSDGFGDYS
jgi:hypothetical protein